MKHIMLLMIFSFLFQFRAEKASFRCIMAETKTVSVENMSNSDEFPSQNKSNSSTNDAPMLNFSGMSEELEAPPHGANGGINELATGFHSDLEDHGVTPVSGVKAARKVDHHEHMLSDDECPKVLTTLETVKKPTISLSIAEEKSSPGTEDLEKDDNVLILNEYPHTADTKKQVVEIQLVKMNKDIRGRPRKFSNLDTDNNPVRPKKLTTIRSSIDEGRNSKSGQIAMAEQNDKQDKKVNRILNKIDTSMTKTPLRPVPVQSCGTIEIPRELLLAEAEIPPTPVILNHVNTGKKLDNDELIAILEGNGESSNVEHFEVELEGDNLRTVPVNAVQKSLLSKDEEREIAMQQIMNLPVKKKGRPKLDPSQKKTQTKSTKKTDATNGRAPKNSIAITQLVSALVSDWDDPESDIKQEQEATEIIVKISDMDTTKPDISTPKKHQIELPQPTFKRQRVIKKKVIWDPDAPETAINYASYAHTTGPGPIKKQSIRKSMTPDNATNEENDRKSASPASLKKKKISEIDRLLGDEGAKNMLDSLNNKSETPKSKATRKITRPEPYDSINHPLSRISARRKEPSPIKPALVGHAKETGVPRKRGPKPSSSWDYVYNAHVDDSMIIRRRSNSSYSSTASANRSSLDLANAPPIIDTDGVSILSGEFTEPNKKKTRLAKGKDKVFEFVKPNAKKPIKTESEQSELLSDIRGKFNKAISGDIKIPIRVKDTIISPIIKNKTEGNLTEFTSTTTDSSSLDNVLVSYSELTVKWHKHCAQLILSPLAAGNGGRYKNLFTIQLMKEISSALLSLDLDKKCKSILITSANNSFCSGIDFTTLIQSTAEKRNTAALELAKTTR